jgi:hypothetical protein
MELAMVGLGRMGLNMAIRLIRVERQPRNSKRRREMVSRRCANICRETSALLHFRGMTMSITQATCSADTTVALENAGSPLWRLRGARREERIVSSVNTWRRS